MINLPFDSRMNLATSPYNVPLEHSTSITSFRMKGMINSVERLDIKKREDTEGGGEGEGRGRENSAVVVPRCWQERGEGCVREAEGRVSVGKGNKRQPL